MKLKGLGVPRYLIALVVFALASAAWGQGTPIPPAHPITSDQVREMLTVSRVLVRIKDSTHQLIEKQRVAAPYIPDALWVEFEKEINAVDWIAIATPIYQKYLSQEDAEKAIAFYKTDAGQHALDSGMAVMTEMMQAGSEQGQAIGVRLGEKYKDQIQENMRKAKQESSPAPSSN